MGAVMSERRTRTFAQVCSNYRITLRSFLRPQLVLAIGVALWLRPLTPANDESIVRRAAAEALGAASPA